MNKSTEHAFPTFQRIGTHLVRRAHFRAACLKNYLANLSSPSDRQRRNHALKRLRTCSFGLLMAATLAYAGLNLYASVLLNRELASIREGGDSLVMADSAPPQIPDANNAAIRYEEVLANLKLSKTEEHRLRLYSVNLQAPKKTGTKWEALLTRNQKAIQLLRQTADMTQCRFNVDWATKHPDQIKFSHIRKIQTLTGLLAADACLQTRLGHTDLAFIDIRALFNLSSHLQLEPTTISLLVAAQTTTVGQNTLAYTLDNLPITQRETSVFYKTMPRVDWNRHLAKAVKGERSFWIWNFNAMRSSGKESSVALDYTSEERSWWLREPLSIFRRPLLKLDEVQALRIWRRYLDALAEPTTSGSISSPALLELNKTIDNLPWYATVSRTVLSHYIWIYDRRTTMLVRESQQQVAFALAEYHNAHGRYPVSLQQVQQFWGKDLPRDEYSGKPFCYRVVGSGYQLYSVGSNGVDNNGKDGYVEVPGKDLGDDISWIARNYS